MQLRKSMHYVFILYYNKRKDLENGKEMKVHRYATWLRVIKGRKRWQRVCVRVREFTCWKSHSHVPITSYAERYGNVQCQV